MRKPLVCFILVNYNGWRDTLECVRSIQLNAYENFKIIVVDNASKDNSIQHIQSFSEAGNLNQTNVPVQLQNFVQPQKQICYNWSLISDVQIKSKQLQPEAFINQKYFLVRSDLNLGFAGGNNLGVELAALLFQAGYFWFLNNDTVIDTNALSALVTAAENLKASEKVGLIQSKVLFYHQPELIQAVGGMFNPKTAWSYHLGIRQKDVGQFDKDHLEFDYVFGASIFASAEFINQVGFMCEDYYLYFEELDWHERGKQLGFKELYCFQSKVYHKQGAATGKKIKDKNRPAWIMGLKYRNLLIFYRKYHRKYIFAAYFRLFSKAIRNISQGNWKEVKVIIQIIFGKTNWTPQ